MAVQRRKRAESDSPETGEQGGWVSSEEEDNDQDDDSCDLDDSSKTRADHRELQYKSCYRTCVVLTGLLLAGFIVVLADMNRPAALNFRQHQQLLDAASNHVRVVMEEEGLDSLPFMNLDVDIAERDAYGTAQRYLKTHSSSFMKQAQKLQSAFADLCGGIRPGRYLLENALLEMGKEDAWVRLLKRKQNEVLHMVVLGNATAAGYGNFHSQAFSFGLEELSKEVMHSLEIDFKVSNVALEHITEFPYLWCVPEFTGSNHTIDIVYVDFGNSLPAQHLELVLRQVVGLAFPTPLLILRDSKNDDDRQELLQHYVGGGIIQAPVLMEWQDAVKPFLQVKKSLRPPGFKGWDDRGVTDVPHLASHWTASQHKMVSWLLTMFLLKQLELLVANKDGDYQLEDELAQHTLPSPILAKASALKDPWSKYVYDVSASRHCRTSFHPADNLKAVDGTSTQDLLIDQPKGMLFYTNSWVLDMENSERKEKIRAKDLGFKDFLSSYRGVPASGKLKIKLDMTSSDMIVCAAQQTMPMRDACQLDQDVSFTIDSKPPKSVKVMKVEAISYVESQTCVFVELSAQTRGKAVLGVEVTSDKVTLANGPCSISHIIWQEDGQISDL